MAYISTEQVDQKRKALKAAFPGWTFSVRKGSKSSSLEVTIEKAPWNLFEGANLEHHYWRGYSRADVEAQSRTGVNPHWVNDHWTGRTREALEKIVAICQEGNHDRSDIQSDYFDVGWYFSLDIGRWGRKFEVAEPKPPKAKAKPADTETGDLFGGAA